MNKILLLLIAALFAFNTNVVAQEYSNDGFKVGVGLGTNEGLSEIGMGTLFSFGYQKSVWKERLRINPNIMTGGFLPYAVTDVEDQYYRITSLGLNGYLDALKYKAFSIFVGAGGFINYSRGLFGTGGWPHEGNNGSEYFFKLYYGGYLGGGIRINPKNKRIAYELTPINVCLGNDYFTLGFLKFGIDIKINKKD